MTAPLPPSDRTRVRRVADNASYDRATLYAIIDDAYLCHVAFSDGNGAHCIPTACWRDDEHLYIHGSNGGRMVKLLGGEAQACVTITHLDGLVLARTAFNHTMNYRSAMIYGRFERVADEAHRRATMDVFMDKIAPGRQHEARRGNDKEFASTTILRIGLDEAACKVRSGGPKDEAEEMAVPAWAGTLPMRVQRLAPQRDAQCQVAPPPYVRTWQEAS